MVSPNSQSYHVRLPNTIQGDSGAKRPCDLGKMELNLRGANGTSPQESQNQAATGGGNPGTLFAARSAL
jgi:hypothetical protein